jgi:6-phosphogluconate dehydrogenase
MQLIGETYAMMKTALQFSDDELQNTYEEWNSSELSSYLLEISAQIFRKRDDRSPQHLIDVVLGVARQTGTGKWTSQDAMELQVPVPTIDAAVSTRNLSAFGAERAQASTHIPSPKAGQVLDRKTLVDQLRNAYYLGSIIVFAQGMALLRQASNARLYNLNLESVAEIWRGGCIIRAALLEPIMAAFRADPKLPYLLLDSHLESETEKRVPDLRSIVQIASQLGISTPAFMASLAYYDAYRSAWLPANLTQAQRDFFGAHTYERKDAKGTFHSDWASC